MRLPAALLALLLTACASPHCIDRAVGMRTVQIASAFYTVPWPAPRCTLAPPIEERGT